MRSRDKQTITAKDVAIMMALIKIARIASGSNQDNFVDLAGYAACAGEIDSYEVEQASSKFASGICSKHSERGLVVR